MRVVSNSGPLIALAKIEQFNLLHLLYTEILIPPAVRAEVVTQGATRPGAIEVTSADWIQVEPIRDRIAVELLKERLDQGESEALVLAIEQATDLLLIDEARGRRVAQAQGVKHIGTVGILVVAKRRGLVSSVTPLLDRLLQVGFRMGGQLYRTAQQLANEAG